MSEHENKALLVAWRNRDSGSYVPVAMLRREGGAYEFVYTRGASAPRAKGFEALLAFPDRKRRYRSRELFAFFANRLMPRSRPDRAEFLRQLGLSQDADDMSILERSGTRATDGFELFSLPPPPTSGEGFYETCFLARAVASLGPSEQERVIRLRSGDRLTAAIAARGHPQSRLDQQYTEYRNAVPLLTDDGACVGYLADYLGDIVKRARGRATVRVEQVNPPPAPLQQRLLCRLRIEWGEGESPTLIDEMYEPEVPQPLRFVNDTVPLDSVLDDIVIHLLEHGSPDWRFDAPPVSARLTMNTDSVPLETTNARVERDDESASLRVIGEDHETMMRLVSAESHARGSGQRLFRDSSGIDLADGSVIDSELAYFEDSSTKIAQGAVKHSWRVKLSNWTWRRPGAVRYWVAELPIGELEDTNLIAGTETFVGRVGLHIDSALTVTLLNQRKPRCGLLFVAEAEPGGTDERDRVRNVAALVCGALLLPQPRLFVGLDEHRQVVAALSGRAEQPELSPPGATSSALLVPQGYFEWARSERRWIVPFLRTLIENFPADAREGFLEYYAALEVRTAADKVAKIGVAIRVLLLSALRAGGAFVDLRPERFEQLLSEFASRKGVRLPTKGLAELRRAHRISIVGERDGWSDGPAHVVETGDDLVTSQETILATFATIVAALTGYGGPVAAGFDPRTNAIVDHWPFGAEGTPKDQIEMATRYFEAGDQGAVQRREDAVASERPASCAE